MLDEIEIPENKNFQIQGNKIVISGEKATLEREYPIRRINIKKQGNKIKILPAEKTAKNKAIIGTFVSHIKNMLIGVDEEFEYKLKVCSSHFPMTVKVQGNELTVSNFIGSKHIKKIKIPQRVTVEVQKDIITVKSSNIEKAGNFASKIESLTHLRKKDRRIFQDGIYMIEKNKRKIQ